MKRVFGSIFGGSSEDQDEMEVDEQCECGNIFMNDSKYCRKCGKERPSHRLEKKPRSSGGNKDVNDRLKLVADALRNINKDGQGKHTNECLEMLANGTKDSLGPKADDRHPLQKRTAKMIGEHLQEEKDSIAETVLKLKAARDAAQRKADKAKKEMDDAQKVVDTSNERVKKEEEKVLDAKSKCEEAKEALMKAKDEVGWAQKELDDLMAKLRRWKDTFGKHFNAIKNGEGDPEYHLKQLIPLLEGEWGPEWGFDECLMGAFKPAAKHNKPDDRCKWCKSAIDGVEALKDGPINDLEAQILNAQKELDDCKAKLAAAEKRQTQACDKDVPAAQQKVDDIKKKVIEASKKLVPLTKAYKDAIKELDDAKENLQDEETRLDEFTKGPWEAYQWLLKQNIGDYNDNTLKPVNTKRAYKEPVTSKIDNVSNALKRGSGGVQEDLPQPCKDMLKNMSPSSLGPKKSDRDTCLEQGNDMVEEVLKKYADGFNDKLNKAKKDLDDAKSKVNRAQRQVNEKEEAFKIVKVTIDDCLKKVEDAKMRCTKATEALKNAETAERETLKILTDLEAKKGRWEDAYKEHFLPLKRGEGNPNAHVKALMPLFEEWGPRYGFEDCLMGGFRPAALSGAGNPGERCDWCKKILDEIDKNFQRPMSELDDEIRKAKFAWTKAKDGVEKCKKDKEKACDRDVPNAQEELAQAEAAGQPAKDALLKAQDALDQAKDKLSDAEDNYKLASKGMKDYQDGVWEDYQFLRANDSV